MKKIKIDQIHLGPFIELIDSINKVDNFISLRIEPSQIKSSVYFPEKDAVKSIALPIENFFVTSGDLPDVTKMCFFNGDVVNSILKRFNGPKQVSAEISLKESGEELHATSITVFNDELKIKISCSDPESGFVELTDEQISHVFDSSSANFEFALETGQKSKFEDLMKIDPDQLTFSIAASDSGVRLSGSSYDYTVSEKGQSSEEKQFLFKKFFSVLDKDDYTVKVAGDKTFFESQQRDISIVFANCEE